VRRWAFAGVMDSIEDYILFLEPQVLAMLKSSGASAATVQPRIRYRRETTRAAGSRSYNRGLRISGNEATHRPEEN
jgi:hypothetical protein